MSDIKKRLDMLRKKQKKDVSADPEQPSTPKEATIDRLRTLITGVLNREMDSTQNADIRDRDFRDAEDGASDDGVSVKDLRRMRASESDDPFFANAGLLTRELYEGPGQSIDDLIPGDYLETPYGPCFRVRTEYPWHYYQGKVALSSLLDLNPAPLELLTGDPELGRMDYTRILFFDTETTGLDTGAGVYIFLAGFGYFSDRSFVVEQYFMRDFPEEPAVLHALSELMARFKYIVTYNGKTYDWPLLESRFAMNRRSLPLHKPPHLDLLHGARKLFKHRLENCRLPSVEAGVLGFERLDDLPGALLPERYFQYVRSRDARFIHKAFAHNAHDIVSLAAILAAMIEFLHNPLAPGCYPAEDVFSVARLRDCMGDLNGAADAYKEALTRGLNTELYPVALHHLSLAYKKRLQWSDACDIWKTMIHTAPRSGVFPYIELAKYCEHQIKNYDEAKNWVLAAQQFTETNRLFYRQAQEELRYRLNRIEAKARRQSGSEDLTTVGQDDE
jgi:uncharacterized protein